MATNKQSNGFIIRDKVYVLRVFRIRKHDKPVKIGNRNSKSTRNYRFLYLGNRCQQVVFEEEFVHVTDGS